MNILFLILAILFLALAVLTYLQKLDRFIAGYNTMSEQEKQKIDRNKMSKSLAITFVLTGIACILGSFSFLSFDDTTIISGAILIVGAIVTNIISKKKD